MLLPEPGLSVLKAELPWLGAGAGWLDSVSPALDLDHLVAFALLASSASLALPHVPMWQTMAALALFAGVTEIAQVWVPGRTASLGDAGLDLAGALLGYSLGVMCRRVRAERF